MPRSSLNNLHLHLSLGLPGFVAPEFLVEEVSGAVHGCRECMHEAEALGVVVGGARAQKCGLQYQFLVKEVGGDVQLRWRAANTARRG